MQSAVTSERRGWFISHAHEDDELANLVRAFLQSLFQLSDDQITCTSDTAYGLEPDAALKEQVHKRLDSTQALFLLATPAAKTRPWVQHECGYASARDELRFYVLTAIASHRDAVAAPYQDRIAVNMSRALEVHSFASHLLKQFRSSGQAAEGSRAEAALVDFCVALERRDADLRSERDAGVRERRTRRVRRQRNWLAAAALLAALSAAWTLNSASAAQARVDALESSKSREDAKERAHYSRIRGVVRDETDAPIEGAKITATTIDNQEAEPTESAKEGMFDLDIGGLKLKDNTLITLSVQKSGFVTGTNKFYYSQNFGAHAIKLKKQGS